MKTTLVFVAFLLFATSSSAQILPQTPWVWMNGDNTIEQPGVYGTQGIAHPNNKPGARNFSTTWRDGSGNLWLFGGTGFSATGFGHLNDLWKYNPDNDNWTWVKGDTIVEQYSIYGTQGIANASNKPGSAYASVSWKDSNNDLWLFGGFGNAENAAGFLNSLWKYDPSINEWTWIKGNTTINEVAVYGTKGISNPNNKPGARFGSRTWSDASGNLWLYGGYGFNESGSGMLNDIWKYDPTINQWTWINGDNAVDRVAVYGTKGISNATNKPGARYNSTSWTDTDGNFWIFGGYGYNATNPGTLNDMWKYNFVSNEWTWISGDNTINQPGVYGVRGEINVSNKPGARYTSSSWLDLNGDLWLFGGHGYDIANPGYLNDLWRYSSNINCWTWVKGDSTVDQVGIYGIQGMPSASNKSGSRIGSVSWTDGNGNLWLFGGYGFDGSLSGVLNDLWKINNLTEPLPVHLLHFSGVLNNETVRLQWAAEMEVDFSHFNIQRSFDGTSFSSIGQVNGSGNNNRNDYNFTDNDLRNRQVQKAFYRLQLMDKNGHFTYSKVLRFDWKPEGPAISLFPNPTVHSLNMSFDQGKPGMSSFSITDMKGIVVKKQVENLPAGRISMDIDVSTIPSGTYVLSVLNKEGLISSTKFIKQ